MIKTFCDCCGKEEKCITIIFKKDAKEPNGATEFKDICFDCLIFIGNSWGAFTTTVDLTRVIAYKGER